jgi:hypothetical protein
MDKIIVFKSNPGCDPVKRPGSGFSRFARVNPGRVCVVKNKEWKREAEGVKWDRQGVGEG